MTPSGGPWLRFSDKCSPSIDGSDWEHAQLSGLTIHESTIVSNYLSHLETGSTGGFSARALQMVMQAIDDFVECFRHELAPGDKRFYRSLSKK